MGGVRLLIEFPMVLTLVQFQRDFTYSMSVITPKCVRPDHLFLGTQAINMSDMKAKNRQILFMVLTMSTLSSVMRTCWS
jgi:hypothetical protein